MRKRLSGLELVPSDGERAASELALRLEWRLACVLWFELFLLIVTLAIGRSVGSAVFLSGHDGPGLALMYVCLGLAVAAMVGVLEWAGRRHSTLRVFVVTLVLSYVLVLGTAMALDAGYATGYPLLSGLLYLLVECFSFIGTLQFWSLANRTLKASQARRLYVFIGTGGIVGSIVGGALTHSFADQRVSWALVWIAALVPPQLLALLAFAVLIPRLRLLTPKASRHWNLDRSEAAFGLRLRERQAYPALAGAGAPSRDPTAATAFERLTVRFGLVSLLMVFSTTLVDYYYKTSADRSLGGDVAQLTSFFGGFYVAVGVLTLVLQAVLTPVVLQRASAFFGLSLSPLALAALAVLNLAWPGLWAATSFKLADSVLSHSVYRSCQEMLYTPLPTGWVRGIKSYSDGVFGRYGLLLAGGMLLLMTPVFERLGGGVLLAVIGTALAGWAMAIGRLQAEFRRQSDRSSAPIPAQAAAVLLAAVWGLGAPAPVGAQVPAGRGTEVAAENRGAFDAGVAERIARIKRHLGAKESLPSPVFEDLLRQLEEEDIDWGSFLYRGAKNEDFPKMLLVNEFWRLPAYRLHPGNSVRRALYGPRPAVNARADGSIRHSSFFTNTAIETYTPETIAREVDSFRPRGAMTITKVKRGGTSEGIWVKDERGRTYILVFDPPFSPEMTTSAEFIGSQLLRLAGYHVPKTCICTVEGTGNALYDGRRAVATIALKDFDGGWLYGEFRERREIRALQVFGGWINNVDQTEQNTGVTVDADGVARHYVLDFGASLGSFTFRPQMARLGWTRLFDPFQQCTQPLYNSGIRKVPWEAPYSVHSPAVGYFPADFDPDRWQPFYHNLGFVEVTEADRRWAAERIARFTDEQIWALVTLAGYSHAEDAEHVAQTLIRRRDIIATRYLPQVRGEGDSTGAPRFGPPTPMLRSRRADRSLPGERFCESGEPRGWHGNGK